MASGAQVTTLHEAESCFYYGQWLRFSGSYRRRSLRTACARPLLRQASMGEVLPALGAVRATGWRVCRATCRMCSALATHPSAIHQHPLRVHTGGGSGRRRSIVFCLTLLRAGLGSSGKCWTGVQLRPMKRPAKQVQCHAAVTSSGDLPKNTPQLVWPRERDTRACTQVRQYMAVLQRVQEHPVVRKPLRGHLPFCAGPEAALYLGSPERR